jgi:hypothetical protein
MDSENWIGEPLSDYRENLIVDVNNPVLAFKAMRDRYTGERIPFAGRPYLASPCSEDALTWNVFRWLQVHGHEDVIGHCLGMETPETILFWGFDCQSPGDHQSTLGELIRSVDGVRRGQVTEPDLVLIGPQTVLFVECKLGRAGQPLYQPWSGKGAKRLGDYQDQLARAGIELFGLALKQTEAECYYQLVRNAFYAVVLARALERQNAVVTALLNADKADYNRRYATPREQLAAFRELVNPDVCQIRLLTWQDVAERIERQLGACKASVRLRQTLEGFR